MANRGQIYLFLAPQFLLFKNQPTTHLASSDAKYTAISQPYRFEVELISENAELDLQSLLHQRAFLAFSPNGLGIHGLIYLVAQTESGKRLTRYKLSIVAQLSYLALRTNQLTFQHLTVSQIVCPNTRPLPNDQQ